MYGGEQQMLSIARSLMGTCRLLSTNRSKAGPQPGWHREDDPRRSARLSVPARNRICATRACRGPRLPHEKGGRVSPGRG